MLHQCCYITYYMVEAITFHLGRKQINEFFDNLYRCICFAYIQLLQNGQHIVQYVIYLMIFLEY